MSTKLKEVKLLFSNVCTFKMPLETGIMEGLAHKNYSPDTMKKVRWVTKMYRDWRTYRDSLAKSEKIVWDLDDKNSITKESLIYAMSRFITEVKKVDGSDYPGKTLYEIVICVQFHLESIGIAWKLLNDETFKDLKYTLDNIMKQRASEGIGNVVKQADVLCLNEEDMLWRQGLLGVHDPDTLLNTIVFMLGKGCELRAGKEHRSLRRPPHDSQFQFLHDDEGQVFLHYTEDLGLKTNKGGIKHHKVELKVVDVYPISNIERCPVRIFFALLV